MNLGGVPLQLGRLGKLGELEMLIEKWWFNAGEIKKKNTNLKLVPLLTMIPTRSQWGHYTLPKFHRNFMGVSWKYTGNQLIKGLAELEMLIEITFGCHQTWFDRENPPSVKMCFPICRGCTGSSPKTIGGLNGYSWKYTGIWYIHVHTYITLSLHYSTLNHVTLHHITLHYIHNQLIKSWMTLL